MQRITPLLLALLILAACQDVIEVDAPQSEPEITIVGMVSDSLPVEVRVSSTAPFFSSGETPVVSGARVELFENDSLVAVLSESAEEPGLYASPFRGKIGADYHLIVEVPGNYPDGVSGLWQSEPERMKRVASVDSLQIRVLNNETLPPAFVEGDYVVMFFQELPGEGDLMRLNRWLNDSLFQRDIFVLEDFGVDGVYFGSGIFPPVGLYGPFPEEAIGDTFRVQLESITADYAIYLRILNEQVNVGSPFDAPPALVLGNIRAVGDSSRYGFGYFRAAALKSAQIVYQP